MTSYPIDWERLYLKKSETAQRYSKPRTTRSIIDTDIRPDAAVFGSALLKHLDKGNTAKAFLEVWTR